MACKNIILIGFMGSGKTTIGRRLAKELEGYRFVDMDADIERKAGMNITSIFEKLGEQEFRKMESDMCKELSYAKSCIIATGGGIIKNAKNVDLLKKNGIVLYLKASPEHVFRNIKDDTSRPLLQCDDKIGKIKQLMGERTLFYESQSDIIVDVTGTNAKRATEAVLSILKGDRIL